MITNSYTILVINWKSMNNLKSSMIRYLRILVIFAKLKSCKIIQMHHSQTMPRFQSVK